MRRYNDIPLFLVLIPLISAFNYYLTYPNIGLNTWTLFTFLADTIQGYLAWAGFRAIIFWLDKKLPYGDKPGKRIFIQLALTVTVSMLIIIILTEIINWIVKDTPVHPSFYKTDIFIIMIWFIGLNGLYIGLHFYGEWKYTEKLREEDKKLRRDGFMVRQGKQSLAIPFEEIYGFYVEGGYAVLVSNQQKKYFLDQSLDKIEENIPEELFFRLNRQFLVSRQTINGFRRADNSKIDVMMNVSGYFPETIQVSRTKAPAFKNWFQPE